ncbi:hypothetical protein D3C76_684450 [compost metagenome]
MRGIGVDGGVQDEQVVEADVSLQACTLPLQLEGLAPGLDQAFPAMFPYKQRFAVTAHERVIDELFVDLGQVEFRQRLAQVGMGDAGCQGLAFAVVRRLDFHPHEAQAQGQGLKLHRRLVVDVELGEFFE